MMLDALAAVSLASAVVQFIQFTTKVASKGQEYHKSVDGAIKEHIELNEYLENFSRLSQRLTNATGPLPKTEALSDEEKALVSVAENCQASCHEIIELLRRLGKSHGKERFASFRLALKAVWSEKKIESSLQRLRIAREELCIHLLVVIKSVNIVITLYSYRTYTRKQSAGKSWVLDVPKQSANGNGAS